MSATSTERALTAAQRVQARMAALKAAVECRTGGQLAEHMIANALAFERYLLSDDFTGPSGDVADKAKAPAAIIVCDPDRIVQGQVVG